MSDDTLSQEEIEALLSGISMDSEEESGSPSTGLVSEDYISELEKDTLGEIGNISFGSSATALSSLLGKKVEINTPSISIVNNDIIESEFIHPYVAIKVSYTAGLSGMNLLVIKQSDAAIIADLMLGGDGTQPNQDLGEIHLSAVQEAMNQMMGSAATSMSTVFNKKVDISPPTINLVDISEDRGREHIPDNEPLIKVSFDLKVGDLIDSEIMQLLPLEFGKELVASLISGVGEEAATVADAPPTRVQPAFETSPASEQQAMGQPNRNPEPPIQQQEAFGFNAEQQPPTPTRSVQPQVQVQQAQFASFESPKLNQSEAHNLDMLMDIPLQVTVELGRTQRSVKEILEMSSGSIIELDKLAGEPVDILVNSRLIAKGEVVVIDENFGVRITDILSQTERLNNLR
ncbi:flagellar motor switch phosphatase FliY [Sporosarcina sp. CAU 1771]